MQTATATTNHGSRYGEITGAEAMAEMMEAQENACYRCEGPTLTDQVFRRGTYTLVSRCAYCGAIQPAKAEEFTNAEIAALFVGEGR